MMLVDSRVGSAEYLEPLHRRLNGQAKSCMLDSGDFAWEGEWKEGPVAVGLELKKLPDFIASMRSGRYADQIAKMAEDYQICYLLIQGSYAPDDHGYLSTPARGGWNPLTLGRTRTPFLYSEIDKYLATVESVENIIVRKSCNKTDTVEQLVNLYNWWQKPYELHDSTKTVKFQSGLIAQKASVCRMVAAQLPHIGWEIAGQVERKFKTVKALVEASEEDWARLSWKSKKSGRKNSLGDKKAMDVFKAIRGVK